MMPAAYQMDVLSAAEVSMQDPYQGKGTLVSVDSAQDRTEVIKSIEMLYTGKQYVVWDNCAWIGPDQETGE